MTINFSIFSLALTLFITGCSTSKSLDSDNFKKVGFEIKNGVCNRTKGVILGIEIDYDFRDLKLKNGFFLGSLMYVGERINSQNGQWGKLPYDQILNIYKLDTLKCTYKFLGNSDKRGKFKVEGNEVLTFAFTYSKLDTCCSNYLNCIIIDKP
jgi:hypothetical protein